MDVIKLDVGGTIFKTTTQTLSSCKYFEKIISKENSKDVPFIDRDPKIFRKILLYLRDPQYDLPKRYYPDMEYFQTEREEPKDIIFVDVGGTLFKTTKQTLSRSRYFSVLFSGSWKTPDVPFVDRDSKIFSKVLLTLRDSRYTLSGLYRYELEYFQIERISMVFKLPTCVESVTMSYHEEYYENEDISIKVRALKPLDNNLEMFIGISPCWSYKLCLEERRSLAKLFRYPGATEDFWNSSFLQKKITLVLPRTRIETLKDTWRNMGCDIGDEPFRYRIAVTVMEGHLSFGDMEFVISRS